MAKTCGVNCEQGRKMGCQTYCCRMLVRLAADEMEPSADGLAPKGFVDKTTDGYCVHFDRYTQLCAIWNTRPKTCREYNCNDDFMLQVAVKQTFKTIVDLAKAAATAYIPKEQYIKVPTCNDGNE